MIVATLAYIYARRACYGREKNVYRTDDQLGDPDTRSIRQLLDMQSEPLEKAQAPEMVLVVDALIR